MLIKIQEPARPPDSRTSGYDHAETRELFMIAWVGRSRLSVLAASLAGLVLIACGAPRALAQGAGKEPVVIGVTGPLTGQYAQYGAQWKKGFDLALDEI